MTAKTTRLGSTNARHVPERYLEDDVTRSCSEHFVLTAVLALPQLFGSRFVHVTSGEERLDQSDSSERRAPSIRPYRLHVSLACS